MAMAEVASGTEHQKRHLLELDALDTMLPLMADARSDTLRTAFAFAEQLASAMTSLPCLKGLVDGVGYR